MGQKMHPCAGQPSRSETLGPADPSNRPRQRHLKLILPNSHARHRSSGGSVHRRLSAAANSARSASPVRRQINALRPATASSRNCSLQTCRSELVFNVSKVASISRSGAPATGHYLTATTGRAGAPGRGVTSARPQIHFARHRRDAPHDRCQRRHRSRGPQAAGQSQPPTGNCARRPPGRSIAGRPQSAQSDENPSRVERYLPMLRAGKRATKPRSCSRRCRA
jgi:hypothetical protein